MLVYNLDACLKNGSRLTSPLCTSKLDAIGNYRPVSVLPIVVKVFECLIHGQLYKHLQDNDILDPAQFGSCTVWF